MADKTGAKGIKTRGKGKNKRGARGLKFRMKNAGGADFWPLPDIPEWFKK